MRREAQRGGCAPIPHLRAMGSVAGQTDSLGSVDATVATGDVGSHFQRDRRCPGTHPLTRRRFFALASRDAGRAWSTRSAVAARPE
jgi:hypothetical protein